MMKFPKPVLRKLDQHGFDHMILGVLFIVGFAIAGTALLIDSHAATLSRYNFESALVPSYCIDNYGNSKSVGQRVYMYPCNTVARPDPGEEWETVGTSSRFMLEDIQDTCISSVGGAGVGHYLQTQTCNSGNEQQMWHLAVTGELTSNADPSACINDPGSARTTTKLILYACGKKPSLNYEWGKTAAPTAATPIPVPVRTPVAPPVSGTVSVSCTESDTSGPQPSYYQVSQGAEVSCTANGKTTKQYQLINNVAWFPSYWVEGFYQSYETEKTQANLKAYENVAGPDDTACLDAIDSYGVAPYTTAETIASALGSGVTTTEVANAFTTSVNPKIQSEFNNPYASKCYGTHVSGAY